MKVYSPRLMGCFCCHPLAILVCTVPWHGGLQAFADVMRSIIQRTHSHKYPLRVVLGHMLIQIIYWTPPSHALYSLAHSLAIIQTRWCTHHTSPRRVSGYSLYFTERWRVWSI